MSGTIVDSGTIAVNKPLQSLHSKGEINDKEGNG